MQSYLCRSSIDMIGKNQKKESIKMARIDHAAIRTKSYEEAQHFFEDVIELKPLAEWKVNA